MSKKLSTTLLVIGVIVVGAAIIWWTVIGPMLVKLPDDINTHMDFEGTLTLYVDQETGALLAEANAAKVPITVSRDFVSVPDLYDSSTAVLEDKLVISMLGQAQDPQLSRYAMDRGSRKCVESPENWAYSPQITVDRTGNYGPLFPGGLSVGDTVTVFFNDPSKTFDVKVVEAIEDWNGLGVTALKIDATRPWADYNPAIAQAVLVQGQGLPAELSFAQLAARLKAGGLDIEQLMSGIQLFASSEDKLAIAALLTQTFPLVYKQSSADVYYIEQTTGATVGATFDRTTGMSVDTAGLAGAIAILGKYASDPTVGPSIKEALGKATALMGADPTTVYNQNMSIVTASEESLAQSAKDKASSLSMVDLWIPVIIIVVGGVLLIVGGVGLLIGSRDRTVS